MVPTPVRVGRCNVNAVRLQVALQVGFAFIGDDAANGATEAKAGQQDNKQDGRNQPAFDHAVAHCGGGGGNNDGYQTVLRITRRAPRMSFISRDVATPAAASAALQTGLVECARQLARSLFDMRSADKRSRLDGVIERWKASRPEWTASVVTRSRRQTSAVEAIAGPIRCLLAGDGRDLVIDLRTGVAASENTRITATVAAAAAAAASLTVYPFGTTDTRRNYAAFCFHESQLDADEVRRIHTLICFGERAFGNVSDTRLSAAMPVLATAFDASLAHTQAVEVFCDALIERAPTHVGAGRMSVVQQLVRSAIIRVHAELLGRRLRLPRHNDATDQLDALQQELAIVYIRAGAADSRRDAVESARDAATARAYGVRLLAVRRFHPYTGVQEEPDDTCGDYGIYMRSAAASDGMQ